jgi:outer membrane protein TolC
MLHRPIGAAARAVFVVLCALPPAIVPGVVDGADGSPRLELTLADAVALAVRNNPDIIKARRQRAVEKFGPDVAEGEFRPKANMNVGVGTGRSGGVTSRSAKVAPGVTLKVPTGGVFGIEWNNSAVDSGLSGIPYETTFGASFSQPLLRGGGARIATAPLREARRREEISRLRFRDAVSDTVVRVIEVYWNFVRDNRRVEIGERALRRAREQLRVNRLLVRAGRMAERDLIQSEAQVATQERSLQGARIALDNGRLALTGLLDVDGLASIAATEKLVIRQRRPDMVQGMELALGNSVEHALARLSLEGARDSLLLAEDDRLWDLRLGSSASIRHSGRSYGDALRGALRETVEYELKLDLDIPLQEDAGKKRALLSARTVLRNALDDLERTRRSVRENVHARTRNVENRFRQVGFARRTRELEEEKLEIEGEKLAMGLSSSFRLVEFEDSLVSAQNAEVEAKIEYLKANAALDRVLGTVLEVWGVDAGRSKERWTP